MEDNRPILVSIRCTVYNHENYIRDCLEGFVMQITNFRFEVIVHDDASTDCSAEIIKNYASKYPEIIHPIYQTENQYSKHNNGIGKAMDPLTTGKYIAYCEGDDYWIDPYKLQKQVDFLESHPKFSAVFNNFWIKNEKQIPNTMSKHLLGKKVYSIKDVYGGQLFPLNGLCVRREVFDDLCSLSNIKANGDFKLSLMCVRHGLVYKFDELMSVYRKTGFGMSSAWMPEQQLFADIQQWYIFHEQLGFPAIDCLKSFQLKTVGNFIHTYGYKSVPWKSIEPYLVSKTLLMYKIYSYCCIINKLVLKIRYFINK